jgi:hypothetical protein
MNAHEHDGTKTSTACGAHATRGGLRAGYRALGGIGGALLCLGCGDGAKFDESVTQQGDAIWWGFVDSVANNQALGLNPVTQQELDRTVDITVTKPGGSGGCTGTLLTYQTVLTAAHCIDSAAGGLLVWPPAGVLDNRIDVGLRPGVDQRALGVPSSMITGNLPYVKRVAGPTNGTTGPNRDYAVIFLERPEDTLVRQQATRPGLTLDGVMGAAHPAFNLPTTALAAGGSSPMIWAGYGITEGPWTAVGRKPDRQFQYFNGSWAHASAATGGVYANAAGVPYPDQPLVFSGWPDGIGRDATDTAAGQIERGYYGSDNGDSGGPLLFDSPTGRQLFALHQSGLTPTELGFRPGKSRTCTSDPALCQPNIQPLACFGPDGVAGNADDRVNTGAACQVCTWIVGNTQCDTNADGTGDWFRQTPDPAGGLPNVPTPRPNVTFPATPSDASCQRDGTMCQPLTLPRTCFGADTVYSGGGDDQVWLGTYDAAGNANCLNCTWNGTSCDTNGDAVADYIRQRPVASTKVDLSTPTLYGPWCPPAPQTCESIGYSECVSPGVCKLAGPREWLTTNLRDLGRPGRLYGERDYASACRTTEDPNCDRFFEDQGPQNCPNFFDAEAGFAPELRNNPPVVYGSEGVSLHDRVDILQSRDPRNLTLGSIAANKGTIVIRNDVQLGKVYGGDHLEVHWRSAWTSALLNNPSTYTFVGSYPPSMIPVAGARVPGLKYTARPTNLAAGTGFPAWNVSVVPPTPLPSAAVTLQNCTAATPDTVISPGSYISSLAVNTTCKVRLSAGKYYFDSLSVQPDAQIRVDHSGGAVEIFVGNQLDFKGRFSNVSGRDVAHVLSYFGTQQVAVQSNSGFLGTFVAPNATLELNSRTHVGAFYAKKVVVHQDAVVRFSPCASTLDGGAR